MNGKGFMIWKINKIGEDKLVQFVSDYKPDMLAIKLVDGIYPYNLNGNGWHGKADDMRELIAALRNANPAIKIGGWAFVYTKKKLGMGVGNEAQAINNAHQKFDLDFWLLDVEAHGGWEDDSDNHRDDDAGILLRNMRSGIKKKIPIGLCSYRYPNVHPAVPYKKFFPGYFENEFTAPQVYWMQAHNPVEQLHESMNQWAKIDGWKYYVPVGAAFSEHGWSPTTEEIRAFEEECRQLYNDGKIGGWLYWELSEAINKPEWLAAIFDEDDSPPSPPPIQTPVWGTVKAYGGLRIRKAPGTSFDIQGWLKYGAVVKILETKQIGGDIWGKLGDDLYCAIEYRGITLIELNK